MREIRTMRLLIDDFERNGRRGDATPAARPVALTPDMEPNIRAAIQ